MPIRLSGLASGLDTESIVAEMMKAQRLKLNKVENKKTKLEWKQEKWQELNKKLYSFYTGSLNNMKLQGSFNTRGATSSNPNMVAVTAGNGAVEGNHQIKVSQLATAQYVTGGKLEGATASTTMKELGVVGEGSSAKISINGKEITVDADMKISDLVTRIKEAGVNASFDSAQKRLFISSRSTGSASAFSLLVSEGSIDLSKMGLGTFDGTTAVSGTMTLAKAQDAVFEYNGASMTSTSNIITANGLTFELLGTTGADAVNINVKKDTQAVYDKIKSFVKEYNELLKQMNELYYAGTAKGYEPLTEEQKSAMSEKEIEKWESKIKDSLLRRDNGIGSLLNTMRTQMSRGVEYDGKSYSLASFGIKSANYTEKGILHINGDKDDSMVAALSDDLMKALEENPEAVMETFNKLAGDLYTSFAEETKSNSLRSALTFYNDKEIKKQIDDYKSDLSAMEKKLADIENRYYKQFTAMEKAMSNMNAQSNYLASMLGTGGK